MFQYATRHRGKRRNYLPFFLYPHTRARTHMMGVPTDAERIRSYIYEYGSRFVLSTHNLFQFCQAVEELVFHKPKLTKLLALRLPLTWQYRLVALRTARGGDLLSTQVPLPSKRAVIAALASVWELPGHFVPCDLQRHRDFECRYFEAHPEQRELLEATLDFHAQPAASSRREWEEEDDDDQPHWSRVQRYTDTYSHWRASVDEVPMPLCVAEIQPELESVVQRSPLWHLLRRLGVGGSTLASIIGFYDGDSSPPKLQELSFEHVARGILGLETTEKTFNDFVKQAIRFGSTFEEQNECGTECILNQEVRAKFQEACGGDVQRIRSVPVGMRLVSYCPEFFILSPDTLYVDADTGRRIGGGEFKCPYLAKGAYPSIPSKYYGQVIQTAYALDLPWCVFSCMWARTVPGGHITKEIAVSEDEVEMTTLRVWINTEKTRVYFVKFMIAFAYYTQLVGAEAWYTATGHAHFADQVRRAKTFVHSHLTRMREDLKNFLRNELRVEFLKVDLTHTRGCATSDTTASDAHYDSSCVILQKARLDLETEFFLSNEELIDKWKGRSTQVTEWNRPEDAPNHAPHSAAETKETDSYYDESYRCVLHVNPKAQTWFRAPEPATSGKQKR